MKRISKLILLILILLGILSLILVYIFVLNGNNQQSYPIDESDRIKLVNRWFYDLMDDDYRLFSIIAASTLIDPEIDLIVNEIDKIEREKNILYAIETWAEENVTNSHTLTDFDDLPGHNPWGKNDKPVYKCLLPTEMGAMKRFSENYVGDCKSISHMMMAICIKHGIDSENIFVIRMKQHAAIIVKLDERIYLIDETDLETLNWLKVFFYNVFVPTGLYNDQYYVKQPFLITQKKLMGEGSLKQIFEESYGMEFSELRDGVSPTIFDLPLQKFSGNIETILSASINEPLVRDLASTHSEIESAVEWINASVEDEPIYPESSAMTADQVIVFGKGNELDRTILLMSLLYNLGYSSELNKCGDSWVVDAGSRKYQIDERIYEIDEIQADCEYLLELEKK